MKNINSHITPYLKGFSNKTFQKLLTKVTICPPQSLLKLRVNLHVDFKGWNFQGHHLLGRWKFMILLSPRIRERGSWSVRHYIGLHHQHHHYMYIHDHKCSHRHRYNHWYSFSQDHKLNSSLDPPIGLHRVKKKFNKEYNFKRESVWKIFKFIVKKNILTFLPNRKVEEDGQMDHPLYCPYHRHIGHVLEDCYVFKDKVESLWASGEIHLQDSHLLHLQGKVDQIIQMVTCSIPCDSRYDS
ncbi:hypothetical protein M5K25_012902 [Dendrobium thyrsiflorum]|uniref:Reverse transcriptase zinc-binding domain-containing protein n=1 Tax=Dendrobium thyrsiflorum TaxID=117978 RepID=A0ABD0UY25_DENTH